ncbi:DUF3006 domain-containing protein [Halorhodospira halophila]|uniref:DUF3006 domain-containing protein n=1 Tax=Halorhodospira halophila (strain DSM 244 / SL1) TaxID=349124 RepID=A1WWL8_HALHL|nr:DUF3006 domain-containing protein [Halorhodospira halophila]ABM62080.1 hypothetical protein Hhal_1313 [Halorhodospira halophila SL1]MBK1729408.1 DUF3006 domain-containing protein [Halorhodospira halophila]
MDEEGTRSDSSSADAATTPATVDAIEDGVARLLVGLDPAAVYEVEVDRLPEGVEEGSALRIEGALTDGLRKAHFTLDPAATEARRERVRTKLDQLRGRSD